MAVHAVTVTAGMSHWWQFLLGIRCPKFCVAAFIQYTWSSRQVVETWGHSGFSCYRCSSAVEKVPTLPRFFAPTGQTQGQTRLPQLLVLVFYHPIQRG